MRTDRKRPVDIDAATTLALNGLTFLAEDENRLQRFLAETGTDLAGLRAGASHPSFLASVLDYLLRDEPLLLVFTASRGLEPDAVYPAQVLLTEASAREDGR